MSLYPKVCGYSIQALSYLQNTKKDVVGAAEIAKETGVPKPMLSQILHRLVKSGLVSSKRGKGGGFALNCDPSTTSLWDIIDAVSPNDELPKYIFDFGLENEDPTYDFWQEHRKSIVKELQSQTLTDLKSNAARKRLNEGGYSIW